jgi:thioesterase domain-containing protein/aryl carrier-like protein
LQIRGYRVEIAEVEAALRALEEVREAVVIARDEPPGQSQLIAYVVPARTPAPPRAVLHRALAATLPDYMIPTAFVLLAELPMTPNGKVDRRALPTLDAQRLELGTPYEAPRTAVEAALVRLWSAMLEVEQVGIHDDFFTLGGHSLLAMQLLIRVRETFHIDISLATLIAAPTVAALAQAIASPSGQRLAPLLLAYKPYGLKPPFFCVHGVELLARHMDAEQPFYALHPHGLDGKRAPRTVEAMATDYIQAIRTCQPQGPYFLGGYSFGGLIALEIAHQLLQQGQQVVLLVLLDSGGPNEGRQEQGSWLGRCADRGRVLLARVCDLYLRQGKYLPLWLRLPYFLGVSRRASQAYTPPIYAGHVKFLRALDNPRDPHQRWGGMSTDGLDVYNVPGNHSTMLTEPHVQQVAMQLTQILRQSQQTRAPAVGGNLVASA